MSDQNSTSAGWSGTQLSSYLSLNRENGNGNGKDAGQWKRHRVSSTGVIICRGAGKSCFVTALVEEPQLLSADSALISNYFPTVGPDSPVYDPTLHELAGRLNAFVNETQARERQKSNKDPRMQIGLVVTGYGLLPAWKIVMSDEEDFGDYGDYADLTDLDEMTDEQRDEFLQVKP